MTGALSTDTPPAALARRIFAAVFAIGFSCVITQLVLLREALGAFSGNELVLGVMLGNWLLIMGLGAALGRWSNRLARPVRTLTMILLVLAVFPSAEIVMLRGLRQFVFLRGASIGVVETVLTSFLVLLPYCLPAGFSLVLACSLLFRMGGHSVAPSSTVGAADGWWRLGAGWVYAVDSLGSVFGGGLFSFVLVLWLDHFIVVWLAAVLNLVVAVWLATPAHRLTRTLLFPGIAALAIIWLVWIVSFDPDKQTASLQLPGQKVLFQAGSPYGRLTVTEASGQTNILENGLLLAASPNIEQAEEGAHYAMAQRPDAQRVLLIGGLVSGIGREILRHDISQLDCVELDPRVLQIAQQFLRGTVSQPRLRMFKADARRFVRTSVEQYDVIIVALPDPVTAQLNRFFTDEFFRETLRILRPEGVLSFAVSHYENYAGPELMRLLGCARQTALRSFRNLLLIPGGRVYFIASNGPLHADIAHALEAKGLATRLVNRHYLKAVLAPDRLAELERCAEGPSPVNRDFKPVLYLLELRHWASQFSPVSKWLTASILTLAAFYALKLPGAPRVIFVSGFAASALEIVLLLGLQVLVGSVYRQVGVVVTVFMTGLALGSALAARWLAISRPPAPARVGFEARGLHCSRQSLELPLGLLAIALALLALALPLLLQALSRAAAPGEGVAQCLIALVAFVIAFLVGAQFPLANRVEAASRDPAARLYVADFIGASLGALLTSTVLVPVIGIAGVCGVVGALNLAAAAMILWRTTNG